ncbi:MAG: ABC transporter permease, partial [Chloroflexi bacterium]|nr:ABC transporter permease [Chloroflexota bacterium]
MLALRQSLTLVGGVLALGVLVATLFAPWIAQHDPFEQNAIARLTPPDVTHMLGRDGFGRDVLARLLYAGRVSLSVGLGAVLLGGAIGTLLGVLAGYGGRRLENALMRTMDVLMAFPSLLL